MTKTAKVGNEVRYADEFTENFGGGVDAMAELLQVLANTEEFSNENRAEALSLKRRLEDLREVVDE